MSEDYPLSTNMETTNSRKGMNTTKNNLKRDKRMLAINLTHLHNRSRTLRNKSPTQ